MNRREPLKALGTIPVVSALGGCAHAHSSPSQNKGTKAHTLQVLLEGAFAVVLQEQSHRLTAFVPLPDPARKDLAHDFYFNDPQNPQHLEEKSEEKSKEKSKGYRFKLLDDGLHTYGKPDPVPYINPGFDDFSARTEVWHLPASLVVLDLPFPRSINFGGRPLAVKFAKGALKPTGLMPTNYVFEYRIDEESRLRLECDHSEMHCSPSTNCPPGVLRYYFGVGPNIKDFALRRGHAVAFFNFLLARVFPELAKKYEIAEIEPSDYELPGGNGTRYPASLERKQDNGFGLRTASLRDTDPRARLLPVASLVDCQSGGFLVRTSAGPT